MKTWPLDKTGKPTRDRAVFKTQKGYNPTYAEIKNKYDWIFVQDTDEQLSVVNFNLDKVKSDWCGPHQPPLISRILEQMMTTATKSFVDHYHVMMNSFKAKDVLTVTNACSMGHTFDTILKRCKVIAAFLMPVHIWITEGNEEYNDIPTIRSKFPCHYVPNMKDVARDGHEERWKAIYNTKHNPPLSGMSVHGNDIDMPQFYALAPRDFHGGLSLELVHQRIGAIRELKPENISRLMAPDYRLVNLIQAYAKCMRDLKRL